VDTGISHGHTHAALDKPHFSRGHPDKNSFKEAQKTIVAEQNPTIALQQSLHLSPFFQKRALLKKSRWGCQIRIAKAVFQLAY